MESRSVLMMRNYALKREKQKRKPAEAGFEVQAMNVVLKS
jgi:hypothetical protein